MAIKNYCDVDPYKEIVIHRVDIELMHKRIMGIPVESSNSFFNEAIPGYFSWKSGENQ